MGAAKPEQVGGGEQLQGPKMEHPAGRNHQQDSEQQGQQQAQVEGLPLALRIMQATGNRRQGNGVVGGEHHLEGRQQGQDHQHLPPLVDALEEIG